MNVFHTHASIIEDYSSYIRSFISIADPDIRQVVDRALSTGKLWPEPLLQFNPSFEMFGGLEKLIESKTLHEAIGDIFKGYKLYRHQVEAIQLGTSGKDFIVTSGTGLGKSLTYIGSIFHHLLSNPAAKGVTALVVYPMNALINSQFEEFSRYKKNYEDATGKEFPIIFGQYTGQEGEDAREKMRENPPHILLTNYMMLELLLTRVRERNIRESIYQNLRFLVFDELHTYRGRQGADVSMLIRRIRSNGVQQIVSIGTSATMVSDSVGNLEHQKAAVAKVATKLFGCPFTSGQVINEKLARSLSPNGTIPAKHFLAAAIESAIHQEDDIEALKKNPIAVWLENKIALEERGDDLVRGKPKRLREIAAELATDAGMPEESCRHYLVDLLLWISTSNVRQQESGERYTFLPYMHLLGHIVNILAGADEHIRFRMLKVDLLQLHKHNPLCYLCGKISLSPGLQRLDNSIITIEQTHIVFGNRRNAAAAILVFYLDGIASFRNDSLRNFKRDTITHNNCYSPLSGADGLN